MGIRRILRKLFRKPPKVKPPSPVPIVINPPDNDVNGTNIKQPIVEPPNAPSKKYTVCANFDYVAENHDECSFIANDILDIIDDSDTWWHAKNTRTSKSGFVPPSYVTKEDKILHAWYCIDRIEAERKLLFPGVEVGTYILRPCKEEGSPYAISVRMEGAHVSHFRVLFKSDTHNYQFADSKNFNSLNELIDYFKNNTIPGSGISLFEPRPREVNPPLLLEDCYIKYADISLKEKIGQGNFGEVYKGFLRSVPVAVKKNLGDTDDASFRKEAEIMHKLCHPCLVKFLGFCRDAPDKKPLIITEFMEKGALKDYLGTGEGRRLEHNDLLYLVMQVAEGMEYLENVAVIHRDLRAANVLVSQKGLAKVADFGLTEIYTYSEETPQPKQVPVRWTAPELLITMTQTRITEGASIKSDVWSFGVLMHEVFTYGELPYKGLNKDEVEDFIKRGNILASPSSQGFKCSDEVYRLMKSCWCLNPDERPSFSAIVSSVENILVRTNTNYQPVSFRFED